MKVTVYKDETYVLNTIREITDEIQTHHREGSPNILVESAVSELIKIEMREIARQEDSATSKGTKRILFDATDKIRSKLFDANPSFDFEEYVKAAEAKLRAPATELSSLQEKLRVSKEMARIGPEKILDRGSQPSYHIKELGLAGYIEGLLVYPSSEICEIDLNKIKEAAEIEGDWFPFQVRSGDFRFVIDDDGSIFTSTEHFSETLLSEAKERLKRIADALYA